MALEVSDRPAPDQERTPASSGSNPGDRYAPMEVDKQKARREGLCFKGCGQKYYRGHTCPGDKTEVRAARTQTPLEREDEEKDAEIAKLKDELESLKKRKDF